MLSGSGQWRQAVQSRGASRLANQGSAFRGYPLGVLLRTGIGPPIFLLLEGERDGQGRCEEWGIGGARHHPPTLALTRSSMSRPEVLLRRATGLEYMSRRMTTAASRGSLFVESGELQHGSNETPLLCLRCLLHLTWHRSQMTGKNSATSAASGLCRQTGRSVCHSAARGPTREAIASP